MEVLKQKTFNGLLQKPITVPTSKELIYNEANQKLVTAGAANGGTIKYKIGNDGIWNETLLLGNTPGDYVVFYKVFGDGNHNDTSKCSLTSIILQNWKRYTIGCLTDSSGNLIKLKVSITNTKYTIKLATFDVRVQDKNPYKFRVGKDVAISETNYNGTQPNVYYPENGDLN